MWRGRNSRTTALSSFSHPIRIDSAEFICILVRHLRTHVNPFGQWRHRHGMMAGTTRTVSVRVCARGVAAGAQRARQIRA